MITVSPAFLDAMYNQDRRSFVYTVGIALADGTSMTLTNEDLFDGGISIEESVSEDSTLQLGSAIINKCTVVLQNFDGRYNYYDFQNARVVVHIGLNIDGTVESFQKGTYIVDEQDFNNSLLTLTCLDNMSLFERAYSDSALAYPASMLEIVKDACTACGVVMATDDFPCCHLIAPVRPTFQGVTFRDVISWAAQCCGCNASVDNLGRLEISYYNFDFLDSIPDELLETWTGEVELTTENDVVLTTESGENLILDADGFNVFKSLYTINVGYNDATISGVRVCAENPESTGGDDAILEYTSGTESYELLIENNGLINTTNAQEVADAVGNRLIGATYRKANFTHLSDPTVAAGNIAVIYDGHGNAYRIIISSTTFTAGDRQNTISAGSNPPRIPDQPPRYTRVVRTTEDGYGRSTQDGSVRSTGYGAQAIRTRNLLRAASPVSSGYNAVRRYSEQTKSMIRQARALSRLGGLYYTAIADPGGGTIHYLHNKPRLEDSEIQIVISDTGIHVTANGLDDNPTWYGMEVNGDLIANILQANGINADWITTGALVIYDDDNNEIFRADKTNKIFRWNMDKSSLDDDGNLVLKDTDETSPAFTVEHDSRNYTNIIYDGLYAYSLLAQSSFGINSSVWYWQDTSRRYGEPAPNIWQVFELYPDDTESGCMINNRKLEEWIFEADPYTYLSSNSNLNNYTTPGNYLCSNATIAATITNTPFTNSAYQLLVFKFGFACIQVAWQDTTTSYIRYRIRTSSGSWGSWYSLTRS